MDESPPAGSQDETLETRKLSFSRRGFLAGVPLAAAGARFAPQRTPRRRRTDEVLGPGPVPIELEVDGKKRRARVEPRESLLDLLRNHLGVTAPKEVCDLGACGACSVLLDGRLVNACLVPALDAEGARVTTAAGLGTPEKPHALQRAFTEHDAMQCGYCTPGMVVAAYAYLREHPEAGRAELAEALAGNLCRCGSYPRVLEAALSAAREIRRAGGGR